MVTESERNINAHIGAGFGKKSADKLYTELSGQVVILDGDEQNIQATDTLYIKSCTDCEFRLPATTTVTKLFIESCRNVTFDLQGRILTHTVELWKSQTVQLKVQTCVQTLQIDLCNGVNVHYHDCLTNFNRLVWSATELLRLELCESADVNHQLLTGSAMMLAANPIVDPKQDQFIVRLVPNKISGKRVLMNEMIVRLANGFPTTEREARQFDAKQEANLKALAKQLMGPTFNIGNNHLKKSNHGGVSCEASASPKLGRNDPCNCGSGKKFKKCCGSDIF